MKPKSAGNCRRSCHVQSRNSRNTGAWVGYEMGWPHLLPSRVPTPVTLLGWEWGVSPPLEGCPGRAAPAGAGRGVQLPPTPAAPGSGSQAGSGRGGPPGAAPERPGGSSGPGPRALGGQGGEGGPLSSPLHPSPSPIPVPPPCRTTEQRFPASSDTTSTAFLRQVLGGKSRGSAHPKMSQSPIRAAHAPTTMPPSPHGARWAGGTSHCWI